MDSNFYKLIKRGYLTEHNVGITEFLGNHKPFYGKLKHRFEDFVVHEIDRQGNVIRLENVDKPEDIETIIVDEERQRIKAPGTIALNSLKIDTENFAKQINDYIQNDFKTENPSILIDDDVSKQERYQIHLYIKQNYPSLDTNTQMIDGKKYITIFSKQKNHRNRNDRNDSYHKRKQTWPSNYSSFVHFVLYKENMETIQVVNELSKRLGVATKKFTYAGNKDKRAISTQKFCAFRINPSKIWQACQEFNKHSNNRIRINVGHFHYEQQPLRLGDLNGNQFEIILRGLHLIDENFENDGDNNDQQKAPASSLKSKSEINELMSLAERNICEQGLLNVKMNGFINYYGMQRFGSHRIDSHKLGILILRKEFKKLVEEILVERPNDIIPVRRRKNKNNRNEISFNEAIRLWKNTRNANEAYRRLNYKYTIEGSLLRGLSKVDENDYHGGLCIGLNRNSRLLYLHAYQSYLWNRIASFRIKKYGLKVVEGDLVYIGPNSDFETINNDNANEDDENDEDNSDESKNRFTNNDKIKANIPNDHVKLVTNDDIGKFTIYDVVIPIIGSMNKFPTNETKNFIDNLLDEDSVTIEQFTNLGQQWCVNGSYRKLLVKPLIFEWNWLEYHKDDEPLIENDLDLINNKNNDNLSKKSSDNNINDVDKNNDNKQMKQALKILIQLPTSSYATICLREITKLSSISLENKPWYKFMTNDNNGNDDADDDDDDGNDYNDEIDETETNKKPKIIENKNQDK